MTNIKRTIINETQMFEIYNGEYYPLYADSGSYSSNLAGWSYYKDRANKPPRRFKTEQGVRKFLVAKLASR